MSRPVGKEIRRGRPAFADARDVRTCKIEVRLTPRERHRIDSYAELHGLTLSECVRHLLDAAEADEGLKS